MTAALLRFIAFRPPALPRCRTAALTLALAAAIGSADAAAETAAANNVPADDSDKKTVELDSVVVTGNDTAGYAVRNSNAATKLNLSPRETPQSLTVITRERLDDQNLTSLRQVLDNTAGIYSDAYDSERVLFYARGFLIDTLMVDGVPAISNFNTGSINETLDTALYDRVEVVRGATGLMSGAGSPAASINLVRKHADSRSPTVSVDLTAGSWNDARGEIDATVPLNADASLRARGVAVYEDRDSYQALYHKKTSVLYGIVDWDLTPSTLLSLGFDRQDNRPRSNTWGSFPLFFADGTFANWPRSMTTAPDWSYWNRRTETAFAELRQTFANDWMLHASLNWRRYRQDSELFYVSGFPDRVTGEGLQPSAYADHQNIIERALDLYASGPFDLFGRTHELVLGYNGSRATNTGLVFDPGELTPVGNFLKWDGSYPRPNFAAQGTPLSDIRTTQNGYYAAARFSLADSLKWIVGARYATWKVDSFYLYDTPNLSNYDFKKTIPYAGLVYDVGEHYSVFASYTGIFKPQNSRDVNGHYLDPINGRSVELGVKGEHFNGRLTSSLTLFETLQNNVAGPVFDPVTGAPVLLPDGSQASRAIDGTRSRGFEFELAGRFSEEWQGSFGWSRTLIHDGTGQPVRTFIPGTLVRTFVTWTPKSWMEGLALGGGINWQSASSTFVSSPRGGQILQQGGLAQVSLMARYQFSPNVSLQLNANNLFDKKYYVLDQYDNTYYGTPANASLTLRVSY
ncbi:MAG: TonB-dependent siderophore receptor [Rudaea sp.]|uniref:TonB-dependent siderophore receptor n=1 Tax=unclassified Rudaea TaxID=2627037 RepID=UPI0010F63B93|nr:MULTISPECIES: TonB-dependent siderophore receptor [unclassified Rudaea]MBN8887342.1 TonB-dependent siderophore receptor [Rudaea sp.]